MTGAEILKVVYGLVQNMNVVMDGEQIHSASPNIRVVRKKNPLFLDNEPCVGGVQEALGTFCS